MHSLIWVVDLDSFRKLWISGTSTCRSPSRTMRRPAFLPKERNEESINGLPAVNVHPWGVGGAGNASCFLTVWSGRVETSYQSRFQSVDSLHTDSTSRRRT